MKTEVNQWVVGKRIPEIAAQWNIDSYQTMVRLMLEEIPPRPHRANEIRADNLGLAGAVVS